MLCASVGLFLHDFQNQMKKALSACDAIAFMNALQMGQSFLKLFIHKFRGAKINVYHDLLPNASLPTTSLPNQVCQPYKFANHDNHACDTMNCVHARYDERAHANLTYC